METRFSLRTLLVMVAVLALGIATVGYFGWKGILSGILLSLAGMLALGGKRTLAVAVVVALILIQLLYPAVDGAREGILRNECSNRIRRITLAIFDYESQHGQIPPPLTRDADGQALHSWRVLILPFLGESDLYNQIDLTKPWDDPVNVPFHNQMPEIYGCPATKYHSKWRTTGNTTAFVVVTGDSTAWPIHHTRRFAEFKNGRSNTLAIIESEHHRTNWMCPDAPSIETFLDELKFDAPHQGVLNVSFFDGSLILLSGEDSTDQINAMLKIDRDD